MLWIYARRVIASVTNKRTIWDGSDISDIAKSMS